jgi:hypothetical protein
MKYYIVCTAGNTKTVYGASEFQSILLQASVTFSTSVKKQKKKIKICYSSSLSPAQQP